jgi:hypothetical protein
MTNPNPSPELKACPSGHTKTSRNNNNIYGAWWVQCADGECSWRTAGDTEADAIAAWNTRALSQTPPAPSLSTDVQSAATGLHEHDVSLKGAMPAPEEVPEGMRPWTGGDGAPDDWDGGPVLRADGRTEHSDDVTQQQWKSPIPRCKWNIVAYTPERALVEVRRNPDDQDWDNCPRCKTGSLDTGFECNACGFDALPLVHLRDACEQRGDRMHPSGLYEGEINNPIRVSSLATVAAGDDEGEASDTVAFVQDWLANADYDPTQFDKGFASAIDARVAAGIEAAAKVAESRWSVWADKAYTDTPQGDRAACADVAAAIRLVAGRGEVKWQAFAGADWSRYPDAVAVCVAAGRVSTSQIQHELGIGFNAACRLVERMEEEGISSKPNLVGVRKLLATSRSQHEGASS